MGKGQLSRCQTTFFKLYGGEQTIVFGMVSIGRAAVSVLWMYVTEMVFRYGMATAYQGMEQFAQAKALLMEAARLHPWQPVVLYTLAEVSKTWETTCTQGLTSGVK